LGSTSSEGSASDSGSSTEPPGACWREIEGDLVVDENTDLAGLADLRVVTGVLTIALRDAPQQDLSFLECLESALLIDITSSYNLVSTRGMVNLGELGNLKIGPSELGSLIAVEGFEGITEISGLSISGASITMVEFPALRVARTITYPGCDISDGGPPLTSTGAFDRLESLDGLYVGGQTALTRVTVLDALVANGAPPPASVEIINNPMLPTDEVQTQLAAFDAPPDFAVVCGNLGEELCKCPPTD
jgi:hypothetical protein